MEAQRVESGSGHQSETHMGLNHQLKLQTSITGNSLSSTMRSRVLIRGPEFLQTSTVLRRSSVENSISTFLLLLFQLDNLKNN